jgi:hypothetical protein
MRGGFDSLRPHQFFGRLWLKYQPSSPMKSTRFLLALAFASFLASIAVQAAEDKAKSEDKTCTCPKDKDGKECGKDKPCCCEAKKAEKGCAMDDKACAKDDKSCAKHDEKKPEKK